MLKVEDITLKADAELIAILEVATLKCDTSCFENIFTQVLLDGKAYRVLKLLGLDLQGLTSLDPVDFADLPQDTVSFVLNAFQWLCETYIPWRNRVCKHYTNLLSTKKRADGEAPGVIDVDEVREGWKPFGVHTVGLMYVCVGDMLKAKGMFSEINVQDLFECVLIKRNEDAKKAYELEVVVWSNTAPHAAKPQKPPKSPKLL